MIAPVPVAYVTPAPLGPQQTSCSDQHQSPGLLSKSPLDVPEDALPNDDYRETRLIVSIDAAGRVTRVQTTLKSGAPKLDAAVIRAARNSRYRPETLHCKRVASRYIYIVKVGAGTPAPGPVRRFDPNGINQQPHL